MTDSQTDALRTGLYEMMDRIKNHEPIMEQLEMIERIKADIQDSAPQQLLHYLDRRSYAKALEFLQHGAIIDHPGRPSADDEEAHL